MKKILVTGGAGYIGSLTVRSLINNGYDVRIMDTFFWGKESIKDLPIEIYEGDCRNSKDVIYALEDIDAVIHLSGIVGENACKQNDKAHFSINVESTRTLVNCCIDPDMNLIRNFIYISSCSVYGNTKGIYNIVNEKSNTSPLSLYADAKLKSEKIIMEGAKRNPHFSPTILRLTTLFGWSPRPRLDLVTNLFTYMAWKGKPIYIDGNGEQYRSLIHVNDVANCITKVLMSQRFLRDRKIFHVGEESNNVTVKEIAETIKKHVPNLEIKYNPNKIMDRRDYKISCDKIKNTFNWKSEKTLEDGIIEILNNLDNLKWDWESYKYRNNKFNYI